MGPFNFVLHTSDILDAVRTLMPEPPVGVPLIESVPQYFGQPVGSKTAGVRGGRVGRSRVPGAMAVRRSTATTLPMSRFTIDMTIESPKR
jgi:hypothetical protein